jgi:predicted nuclease with RNAse H fold
MLYPRGLFVGINPASGRRPVRYAALDTDLHVVALDQGDLEQVLAFVAGAETSVVAVNAPQSLSKGLMQRPEIRLRYNLPLAGRRWRDWRVCEFELRRRNIRLHNSPSRKKTAPAWLKAGFKVFRRLGEMGYSPLDAERRVDLPWVIETQPHAGYTVLLGHRPFYRASMEGCLQRQLVLYVEGLDVVNPMHALEEITRHHLLSGELPLETLYDPENLDALLAAYTGYLTAVKPEKSTQVGLPSEGLITLAAAELKPYYT